MIGKISLRPLVLPALLPLALAACETGLPSNGLGVVNAKGTTIGVGFNTTTGDASLGYDSREISLLYSPNSAGPDSGPEGAGKALIDGTRGEDTEARSAITVTRGDAGANILEERAGLAFESMAGVGFASRAIACAIFAAASDVDPSPKEC